MPVTATQYRGYASASLVKRREEEKKREKGDAEYTLPRTATISRTDKKKTFIHRTRNKVLLYQSNIFLSLTFPYAHTSYLCTIQTTYTHDPNQRTITIGYQRRKAA